MLHREYVIGIGVNSAISCLPLIPLVGTMLSVDCWFIQMEEGKGGLVPSKMAFSIDDLPAPVAVVWLTGM